MAIQTKRLLLRPWSEDDRDRFAALATDARVTRYIGAGSTWSRDRINEVFDRQLHHWEQHGFGWRSATEESSSTWIGFVGLNHVGPEATEVTDDEVEIGWWISPESWRKGFATEGALALRNEAFDRVGLDRIIGRYQPANEASGRIMERIGMEFERDAIGTHGEVVRIYSLNRARWAACLPGD